MHSSNKPTFEVFKTYPRTTFLVAVILLRMIVEMTPMTLSERMGNMNERQQLELLDHGIVDSATINSLSIALTATQ
eukprot:scaffold15977_cov60-Cylindrotheca_fusiformis.AAC.1